MKKKYSVLGIFGVIFLVWIFFSSIRTIMLIPGKEDLVSIDTKISSVKCSQSNGKKSSLLIEIKINGNREYKLVKGINDCVDNLYTHLIGKYSQLLVSYNNRVFIWQIKNVDSLFVSYKQIKNRIIKDSIISPVFFFLIFFLIFFINRYKLKSAKSF